MYVLIYDTSCLFALFTSCANFWNLMNADKMLKERFLNRDEEVIEEEFTDDEESEDEVDGTGEFNVAFLISLLHTHTWHRENRLGVLPRLCEKSEQLHGDDNEDREQDRLAKHFAKRARRNRILEEFVGDSQFSRSRLIDEDVTMQQDLKSIKVSPFDVVFVQVVARVSLM